MSQHIKACGAILSNDSGSDYVCTEPLGHTDDHCDARHPRSWPYGVTRMVQGRQIAPADSQAQETL